MYLALATHINKKDCARPVEYDQLLGKLDCYDNLQFGFDYSYETIVLCFWSRARVPRIDIAFSNRLITGGRYCISLYVDNWWLVTTVLLVDCWESIVSYGNSLDYWISRIYDVVPKNSVASKYFRMMYALNVDIIQHIVTIFHSK